MIFKEYPPEASPAAILDYGERYRFLQKVGVGGIELAAIPGAVIDHLAQLARKYDAQGLKRFAPSARHGVLACFLVEAQKSLLDHLATMHDQFLTGMSRRSRNAFEERHREFRKRAKRGVETLLWAVEIVLDRSQPDPLGQLQETIDDSTLRSALADCREFQRLEENGYQEEMRSRHSHLRRYLPAFLTLPFQAEPGTQSLLRAIEMARRLDEGGERALPEDAPDEFIPAAWRNAYKQPEGRLDKCLWDIALALSVWDALRSGDLFLPASRHHVSFDSLVYDEHRCARRGPVDTNSARFFKRPMRCCCTSAGSLRQWRAARIAEWPTIASPQFATGA